MTLGCTRARRLRARRPAARAAGPRRVGDLRVRHLLERGVRRLDADGAAPHAAGAYRSRCSTESPLHYRFAGGFFLIVPALVLHLRHPAIPVRACGGSGDQVETTWPRFASSRSARRSARSRARRRRRPRRSRDGEFVVLLGPSGCGKTTLLRCIAGLETQSTAGGSASAAATSTDLPPRERRISMVFQSYAVFPHMKVLREHRLRPAHAEGDEGARSSDASSAAAALLHIEPARPLSGAALGRPAPARRGRARARRRAGRPADGRAALEPRRAAAPADARGAEGAPARARARRRSTSRTTRPRR